MKKIIAILFVAAVMVAGLFAESTFPSGHWVDDNWNGEWVIGAGTVELLDSVSGKSICKFDSEKMEKYKLEATTEGITLSFYYAETQRHYSFIQSLTDGANLILRINPDWEDQDYQKVIEFKAALEQ
ncbi:MAG: hypothetical protein MJ188_03150 [Treponema sp.]|nr:hypothetical protein [Treponema sp.]